MSKNFIRLADLGGFGKASIIEAWRRRNVSCDILSCPAGEESVTKETINQPGKENEDEDF